MPFHFVCPQYSENVTVGHINDAPGYEAPGVVHMDAPKHASHAPLPDQGHCPPQHEGKCQNERSTYEQFLISAEGSGSG